MHTRGGMPPPAVPETSGSVFTDLDTVSCIGRRSATATDEDAFAFDGISKCRGWGYA